MSRFMPELLRGAGWWPLRCTLGLTAHHALLGITARTARVEVCALNAPDSGATALPLDTWLRQQPVARKQVDITVSNACAHHLLVPRHRALASYRERDGYARAVLEEAYGLDAAGWHCAADDDPFAAQFLTAALPRSLLARTQAALGAARARGGSVQSFFTREWNAQRRKIGTQACWFAVIEAACTVLARVERGRLVALRTLHGPVTDSAGLVQAVEREALAALLDEVPKTVFITGEALFASAVSSAGGFSLRRLDAVAPPAFAAAGRSASRLLWNA